MKNIPPKKVDPSLYDRDYFLSHCEGYREFSEGRISPRLKRAIGRMPDGGAVKVLDVGCGRGELVQYFAREGCSCEGVDYSDDAIAIAEKSARERLSEDQLNSCRFSVMDATSLDFDDNTFDVSFMLDVVEHMYPATLQAVLKEVHRVLRPGGRLLIHTVPNKWVIKPARMAMRVLNIPSETERHVNEQSLFTLKKAVRPYFSGDVWIERERGFWSFWGESSNRAPNRKIALALQTLDLLLDNRFISPLVDLPPFIFFVGTDIWADITTAD